MDVQPATSWTVPEDVVPTAAEACFVFDILCANVKDQWKENIGFEGTIPSAGYNSGLFVKYKLFDPNGVDWTLRGCMGTFDPYELRGGLAKWAVISGSKDPRFKPITADELERIECTVSFLSPMSDCKDPYDWTIGDNGIRVWMPEEFHAEPLPPGAAGLKPNHPVSATYLPEIAVEHGWTQAEALSSACNKGGYKGEVDEEVRRRLTVKKYQTTKYTLKYADYVKMKGA